MKMTDSVKIHFRNEIKIKTFSDEKEYSEALHLAIVRDIELAAKRPALDPAAIVHDVNEIYNTHLEEESGERPLRNYSYSVIQEFWADSVLGYYGEEFNNYNVAEAMKNTPEYQPPTDDIKNMVEKYICIAENNYNLAMCQKFGNNFILIEDDYKVSI